MSRSRKGSKGVGYEYWGRRQKKLTDPGKDTKIYTSRAERRKIKQEMTDSTIILSETDYAALVEILENPPKPTEVLIKSMKKYRESDVQAK